MVFLQIFIRQLSQRFCRMRLAKGLFALFPESKKVRHVLRALGRTPHSSPWAPAAYAVPMDREEEQDRRRQETHQQASEALEMARLQLDQASKRRKRHLPKSSSHSSHRRARRCHPAVAGIAGFSSSRSVLLLSSPRCFITAGIYQKDSYAARMPLFPCEGGPRILKSVRDSIWRFYEPFAAVTCSVSCRGKVQETLDLLRDRHASFDGGFLIRSPRSWQPLVRCCMLLWSA